MQYECVVHGITVQIGCTNGMSIQYVCMLYIFMDILFMMLMLGILWRYTLGREAQQREVLASADYGVCTKELQSNESSSDGKSPKNISIGWKIQFANTRKDRQTQILPTFLSNKC